MAIPGSGPISMSMLNTEVGKAATVANSRLASGSRPSNVAESVPGTGSLFWLGNYSGSLDQTAPHAISEWRNYTTVLSLTVFARAATNITVGNNIKVYYKVNAGSYTLLSSQNINLNCNNQGTISNLSAGDKVYIVIADVVTPTTNGATFTGNDDTSACTSIGTQYCDNTSSTVGAFVVTMGNSDKNCALHAQTAGGAYVPC